MNGERGTVSNKWKVLLVGMLILGLTLTAVTIAAQAQDNDDDFDILLMLPAIIGASQSCNPTINPTIIEPSQSCNFASLKQMFKNYADKAAALVAPADKTLVINYVSEYTEGGAPLEITDNPQGYFDHIIPSRAAAFYLAGVKAVTQQNRVVAFWCFSEAAWRNPRSPMFLNNAAFALIEFGYLKDALKALQCANSLAPDFISPYINLGKVLDLLGRCAEAAEHYYTGFSKFPNNPHYLWLAASAYKCAGNLFNAWSLGQNGKVSFPGVYDWDGFLSSLNYTPPIQPNDCGTSPSCQSSVTCANLAVKIQQYANEMGANSYNYIINVHNLAYSKIGDEEVASRVPYYENFENCRYQPGANVDCCLYQFVADTFPSRVKSKNDTRDLFYDLYDFKMDLVQGYLKKAMADYQGALPSLTEEQASYLLCLINSHDGTTYVVNELNNSIIGYQRNMLACYDDLSSSNAECIESSNAYNPSPDYAHNLSNANYVKWITTGHVTTGLGPEFCLTVVCFHADAISGNYGFSVNAGGAIKFTRNAFTGDAALNLGIGLKMGVGMANIGGGAWVKFSRRQIGVEAKVNFGPVERGYFYGAERL